jgi:hypothetical protein
MDKNYREAHKVCPNCGSKYYSSTYAAYIDPPDMNEVKCSCGWSGIVDDLVADLPEVVQLPYKDWAELRDELLELRKEKLYRDSSRYMLGKLGVIFIALTAVEFILWILTS